MFDAPKRSPSGWPPGHQVGRFTIVRTIGEGGMGVVYLAQDPDFKREVALKVLHSDIASNPTKRKRFVREGKFLNALTHTGIASVYEVGEADDRVFIAMEYVEGPTLTVEIKKKGRLPVERALKMGRHIASALGEAHEMGIIHRDVKPDNVIVCEGDKVKILDFGIAKSSDPLPVSTDDTTADLTTKGQLLGTPAYMSPEQAKGLPVDQRSDVFSMGIVLYEMLTGRRPFAGETWQELIIAVNRETPKPMKQFNQDVSDELQKIVDRCLQKSAEPRYKNCAGVAAALDKLVVAQTRARMPKSSQKAMPPRALGSAPSSKVPQRAGLLSRHPWILTTLILIGLIVATVVGMAFVARSG